MNEKEKENQKNARQMVKSHYWTNNNSASRTGEEKVKEIELIQQDIEYNNENFLKQIKLLNNQFNRRTTLSAKITTTFADEEKNFLFFLHFNESTEAKHLFQVLKSKVSLIAQNWRKKNTDKFALKLSSKTYENSFIRIWSLFALRCA